MDLHMGPVHRWAPVSTVTISVRLQTELIIQVTSIKLEREAKQKDQTEKWKKQPKKIPDQMVTGSQKWENWAAKRTYFKALWVMSVGLMGGSTNMATLFQIHQLNSAPHGTLPIQSMCVHATLRLPKQLSNTFL